VPSHDPDHPYTEATAEVLKSLLYHHTVNGFDPNAGEQGYGRFWSPLQLFVLYASQGAWNDIKTFWDKWRQQEPRLWAKVEGLLIDEETGEPHHFTELGNAKRFAAQHHEDVRHCDAWGWLVWDCRRWVRDELGFVMERAKQTVKAIYTEAGEAADKAQREALAKHALRSESHRQITAMLALAQSDPRIKVASAAFDTNPWLLNVLNGTIDLRTGELHSHRREHLITKLAPVTYDSEATCPLWWKFLEEIFLGRRELIAFVRRAIGYSLSGEVRDRVLFIPYGKGRNGKSTLLEVIAEMLGDYSLRTPTETLMIKAQNNIPNDLAQLPGRRFVHASESEEGKRLSEALVKDLTGRDTISARFMRGEFFEFRPVCKIWLRTNHKPVVRGTDDAIWDRIRLIPFDLRIPEGEEDHGLPERLRAELPGILTWAVQGCLSWQVNGLGIPEEVRAAGKAYRDEMDTIGQFLTECCTFLKGVRTQSAVLYDAYCAYAGDGMTQTMFARRMKERGLETKSINGRVYWHGIELMTTSEKNSRG
jgi:putative DNA primase/helicase